MAIVLSLSELLYSGDGLRSASTLSAFSSSLSSMFTMAAVVGMILGLGTLTTGIVLLAQHRRRSRGTPITLLAFGSLAILAAAANPVNGFGIWPLVMTLPLSLPVIIVLGIGIAKEKRGI